MHSTGLQFYTPAIRVFDAKYAIAWAALRVTGWSRCTAYDCSSSNVHGQNISGLVRVAALTYAYSIVLSTYIHNY
eukprot:4007-Heterococcus_DN1.PRE.6